MPRALDAEELRGAQQALAQLRAVQLVKAAGGRGQPPTLPPLASALAVRRGDFDSVAVSTQSRETAAAQDFGVPVAKVRQYIRLLSQMAPPAGAQPLQTMGAARERLRGRMFRQELELREVSADGNCQYRAMAIALQDMGMLSVQRGYFNLREDLADFLKEHRDKESGSNELGGSTGVLFDEALADVNNWVKPDDWPDGKPWPPTTLDEARASTLSLPYVKLFTHCVAYCAQILECMRTDGFWASGFSIRLATLRYGLNFYIMSSDGTAQRH